MVANINRGHPADGGFHPLAVAVVDKEPVLSAVKDRRGGSADGGQVYFIVMRQSADVAPAPIYSYPVLFNRNSR
jgi:hypothetical protein